MNAGRLVVSADDLIAEYPLYIERAGKKAIDELLRDIEDASDLEVPIPNTHRGALADLTSEERENAIQKHISEETAGSILNTYLSDASLKHKPEQSLEKCLNSLTKKDLQRIANNLQLSRTSKLKKAELASIIAVEITTNPLAVSELLDYAYIGAIDSIQHAVESHNATEIANQTATDYKYLLPFAPLSFLFSYNDEYSFVIPKEIFRVLQTLDWEQLKKKRTKQTKLAHFIEAQVDVCGIINLEDINRACNGFFDDAISANDINDVLAMQLKVEYPLFQQACIDNVEYLITDAFQPLPYIQSNVLTAFVDDRYKDKWEELGSNIQDSVVCLDILNAQAGKPARLLTKNDFSNYDIDQFDIMRLIEEKPSFIAFRAYLDERVPDDEDDYYYADSLLEKICMAIQYGTPIEKTFEFLLDSEVCVENIAQVNQLFGLFANFYNDIPQWNNHGWSPNELHEMTAKKSAKNKVGRNDPCPL